MLDSIDFNEIKELFNPTEWDVAYVSADNFKKGGVKPIKHSHHFKGVPWAGIYEDGELVYNINDLDSLNPKEDAVRIGHSVGTKKRIVIVTKALEGKFKILNARVSRDASKS